MKQREIQQNEIRRQARRCDVERERIRQMLYALGYGPMTLREAVQLARKLTRRH